MSIYSRNIQSPFSGNKGKQLVGVVSKRKSRASMTRLGAEQKSNEIIRSGTILSSIVKGVATTTTGFATTGQGLVRTSSSMALTTSGGIDPYDGAGIIAAGGDPINYLHCSCGTDFTNAAEAWEGKKNVLFKYTLNGIDYDGILDRDSFSHRTYKVYFPTMSFTLDAIHSGDSNSLNVRYTT